ncbi:hypothetical protein [Pasteurella testudinis]|uniref:hypothetical protein n=1 Tax=Pasteurella testudinis TaxID=761 RepID=UPI004059FF70
MTQLKYWLAMMLTAFPMVLQASAEQQSAGVCIALNTKPAAPLTTVAAQTAPFRYVVQVGKGQAAAETPLVSETQLEDIQRQLAVADALYQQVLGLSAPLSMPRYAKAHYIQVSIQASERRFGLAYDEVTTTRQEGSAGCHINMLVSNQVYANRNGTPAHELFHLYQNSYMMFKQAWLSEGLARWSESLLATGVGVGADDPLPQNREELESVMAQSYPAAKMWIRLFRLLDDRGEFSVAEDIAKKTYTDNSVIVKDKRAYGTAFIRPLFEALAAQSAAVSRRQGWQEYGWAEREQKNPAHNRDIWLALKRAIHNYLLPEQQTVELKQFLQIELP